MFLKPGSAISTSKRKTFLMSFDLVSTNQSGDVIEILPYDVKDEDLINDDADTDSLTLDSLEEDLKTDQCLEEAPLTTAQSAQNEDIFFSNDYVQRKTETDNMSSDDLPKWNGVPKSDLPTSEMNTNSGSNSPGDKEDSEPSESFSGKTQVERKCEIIPEARSSSECPQVSQESSEANSEVNANNGDSDHENAGLLKDGGAVDTTNGKLSEFSSSCSDSIKSTNREEAETGSEHTSQGSQSLAEDSSSASSQKNAKRSGIPRRLPSDDPSTGNHDPTPTTETSVRSPRSLRRSLSLNTTADLAKKTSSRAATEDLTKKSPVTPRPLLVDVMKKNPSSPRPEGLKKSSSVPGEEGARKSPASPRSVEGFPVVSPCGSNTPLGVATSLEDPGKWEKRHSLCETMSVMSASSARISGPVSRDTIASRLRIEKQHQCHELNHDHHHHHNGPSMDHTGGGGAGAGGGCSRTYLTPSQRKDLTIRELKAQVFHLTRQLEAREVQLQEVRETSLEEKQQIRSQLEEALGLAETAQKEVTSVQDSHKESVKMMQTELGRQLAAALSSADSSRQEVKALQESHEESVKLVALLQQELEDVKKEMARRLAQAEEVFLEMYKKGRDSAVFEREEELELQGKDNRAMNATEAELRNKLLRTQAELAKWQTIQRHDSYHATPLPATEAETTLAFLKDSMYHFLTSDKTQTSDEHLRAVVRILEFSQAERDKIAQSILTKRNKSLL